MLRLNCDDGPSVSTSAVTNLLSAVFSHRLVIVSGKGGVGKTTCAGWMALFAGRSGRRTVAAELDSNAPLARLFGLEGSLTPVEVLPNLSVILLDGRRALEEYLRLVVPGKMLLGAILSSKLYDHFVAAAPGLRELMTLGKVYELLELTSPKERPEVIVVDGPATGQALSWLRMPFTARETFAGGLVGREADNIGRMLKNRRATCAVLVATPESLAVKETLDCADGLQALGIKLALVILNRFKTVQFTASDVKLLVRKASRLNSIRCPELIAELALNEVRRAVQSRRSLRLLRSRIKAPVLALETQLAVDGSDLVQRVAQAACSRNAKSGVFFHAFV